MNPENNNESVGADSDMQKLEDQDNTYAYGSKPRTSDFKIGIIAILIGGALVFILIGIYVAWLPIFVGVALIFKFKTDNCFVAGLLFTVYAILTIIIVYAFFILFSALGFYDGLGLLAMI